MGEYPSIIVLWGLFRPEENHAGDVQAAGSAAAELASAAREPQTAGQPGVVAAAKPALAKPAKLADQALADFNAEMADLGEEIHTA